MEFNNWMKLVLLMLLENYIHSALLEKYALRWYLIRDCILINGNNGKLVYAC